MGILAGKSCVRIFRGKQEWGKLRNQIESVEENSFVGGWKRFPERKGPKLDKSSSGLKVKMYACVYIQIISLSLLKIFLYHVSSYEIYSGVVVECDKLK